MKSDFARRALLLALIPATFLSLPLRAQEVLYEVQSSYQYITVRDTANGYR